MQLFLKGKIALFNFFDLLQVLLKCQDDYTNRKIALILIFFLFFRLKNDQIIDVASVSHLYQLRFSQIIFETILGSTTSKKLHPLPNSTSCSSSWLFGLTSTENDCSENKVKRSKTHLTLGIELTMQKKASAGASSHI